MNREHVYYFDYLRIFAMSAVIFMHTAANPLRTGGGLSWRGLNAATSLCFSAVPLFLMMSGYLTLSQDTGGGDYIAGLYKRRLPRLVLPLCFWSVVAILWQSFLSGQWGLSAITGKLYSLLQGPVMTHFWYLYTLIPLFVISPFLSGISRLGGGGRKLLLCLIAFCTAYTAGNEILALWGRGPVAFDFPAKLLEWGAGGHLLSFLLGYLLGSSEKRAPNVLLIAAVSALLALISVGTRVLTEANGQYTQTLQSQSSGLEILLAAGIFLLFKNNLNRKCRACPGLLSSLTGLSLGIYLMHNILLSMFSSAGIVAKNFGDTLLIAILNLTVCFVVLKTVATIKPLCYPAAGISFGTASGQCNWIFTWKNARRREKIVK